MASDGESSHKHVLRMPGDKPDKRVGSAVDSVGASAVQGERGKRWKSRRRGRRSERAEEGTDEEETGGVPRALCVTSVVRKGAQQCQKMFKASAGT